MNQVQRISEPSLLPIMLKFLCIMIDKTNEGKQNIDDERRLFPSTTFPNTFCNIGSMSPDVFWDKILNYQEPLLLNLAKFVLDVFSLPHANADSERNLAQLI